jgi:hypothetical protein
MLSSRVFSGSVLFLTLFLFALLPWPASTGEYHVGQSLLCYDCHSMHYSQSHSYAGSAAVGTTGAPNGDWLGASGGPFQSLLKAGNIDDLCLACHDGKSFAPDVFGENANTYVRQGGALNRGGGAAPYESWKGHTLDMDAYPPGGTSNLTLTCKSCHQVHGSVTAYRNLNGCDPSVTSGCITYSKGGTYGSRDRTRDVWLKQWTLGDLQGNYSYDSVRFNEPQASVSRYSRFCAGCHNSFHGAVGDGETVGGTPSLPECPSGTCGFIRHPNSTVNIGALNPSDSPDGESSIAQYNSGQTRVHVMSNLAAKDYLNPGASFSSGDGLTPSCFSCHKGHGNQNPFGLIFLNRNAAIVTDEGGFASGQPTDAGTGLQNLCGQCHMQGN